MSDIMLISNFTIKRPFQFENDNIGVALSCDFVRWLHNGRCKYRSFTHVVSFKVKMFKLITTHFDTFVVCGVCLFLFLFLFCFFHLYFHLFSFFFFNFTSVISQTGKTDMIFKH